MFPHSQFLQPQSWSRGHCGQDRPGCPSGRPGVVFVFTGDVNMV